MEASQLDHNTSGQLTYKQWFFLTRNQYTVMETDYNTYAILHECTTNGPAFLNYRNDDVHILTRSETVTSGDLDTYKATANAAITDLRAFEDIEQKTCLPQSWRTKFGQLFTNPDQFWRKW